MLEERGNIDLSLAYFLKFKIPKEKRILEIGCRFGSLLHLLQKAGYQNIIGIDIDKGAIEKGISKYPELEGKLIHYNGERLPFNSEEFEVVLMFDIIEHLPSPKQFLANQVNRVLKQNTGKLIFQTPNKIINIPWEILQHKSFTAYKGFHPSLQSYHSLQQLFMATGFTQILIEKNNLLSAHNVERVKKEIGFLSLPLLKALQKMPIIFFPNFWGVAYS